MEESKALNSKALQLTYTPNTQRKTTNPRLLIDSCALARVCERKNDSSAGEKKEVRR